MRKFALFLMLFVGLFAKEKTYTLQELADWRFASKAGIDFQSYILSAKMVSFYGFVNAYSVEEENDPQLSYSSNGATLMMLMAEDKRHICNYWNKLSPEERDFFKNRVTYSGSFVFQKGIIESLCGNR